MLYCLATLFLQLLCSNGQQSDLTSIDLEQYQEPDTNLSSRFANVLLLLLAKFSLVYLCVSFHHLKSNSWQPLLIESQVGGRSDQLTECVFLLLCHLDFWNMLDLLLNHFLLYLSKISLRLYKAGSDETHLEIQKHIQKYIQLINVKQFYISEKIKGTCKVSL